MAQIGSTYLILTSINPPNKIMAELAAGASKYNWKMILIGDVSSPSEFSHNGIDFYSISRQLDLPYLYSSKCPTKHYARKNIGYLVAISNNAKCIIETDDDNFPLDGFFSERTREFECKTIGQNGWVNIYKYFSNSEIWPRGLPLSDLKIEHPEYESLQSRLTNSPVQQGLADANPDVDAIYRMTLPLPVFFDKNKKIALEKNSWCPFNSQNTTWWPDAYPLLYLPAYCSFRMTDIWRSFICQRIMWENNWNLLFHSSTVEQERNEHDLMKDFNDEIPGYLNNKLICKTLESLNLRSGIDAIPENMLICYEALVRLDLIKKEEIVLLEAWENDINNIRKGKK